MFRHRRQLRRWAARVLFLWLFGVGAGVANACLVSHVAAPGQAAAGHAVDAGGLPRPATAEPLAHTPSAAPAHHCDGAPGSVGKSNCQDFCDKASVSIPRLNPVLDDAAGHALPLPAAALVVPAPAFAPIPLWLPRRDGAWAPPITIAFLRLAL